MSYFPRTSAEINVAEMRQQLPVKQQLEQLREQAKQALLNVSLNRKKLYDIVVDLKEHFHEYGFKSAAAAVENVIPRSKRWANIFCAEIEAELEVYGEVVGKTVPTEPDRTEKKEQKALSQVEKAREEEPEKPRVKMATEVIAENAGKNGHIEAKPISKTKPITDKSGCIIPQHLLQLYERREELTKPMHYIAQVRTALEELQTEKDVLYMSIVHNGIVQTTAKCAESLYHALRECQPEIVCPECDGGQNSKSIRCNECGGSGMISEENYNRAWVKSTRPERLAVVKGRLANK